MIISGIDIYTFLTALLVIYIAYNYLIWPRTSPLKAFPGPNYRLPFVGSVDFFKIIFKHEGYKVSQRAHEKYGPISRRFIINGKETLVVTGAAELAQILYSQGKSFDRSKEQCENLGLLFGKGLLSTRGEEHDIMRRILNPSFTINNIKRLIPKFTIHANRLLDYWTNFLNEKSNKDIVELYIHEDIPKMTLDIIMECAFGYKNHSCLSSESSINKALDFILRSNNIGFRRLIPLLKYLPLKKNRIMKESQMLIEETINKIIAQKKEQKTDLEELSSPDLLDRLLLVKDDDGSALTDKELFDHTITFIFAGFETTSTSLTWALLNLAQNPEIQQRLREEILSICPENSSDVTWEQLEKMSYLNGVIMESLRHNPTVPAFQKVTIEDVVIGDYVIPANTLCSLWIGVAQTSKNHWSGTELFNPDHFLDSEEKKKIQGSFLPFGGGKTLCIGNKFALAQMKVVLITLIRNLIFSTVPELKFETKTSITSYPSPFFNLRIQKYEKK